MADMLYVTDAVGGFPLTLQSLLPLFPV